MAAMQNVEHAVGENHRRRQSCAQCGKRMTINEFAFKMRGQRQAAADPRCQNLAPSAFRALFSEIAKGASAKTVCTIRRARSDTVQDAEKCSSAFFSL